MIFFPIYLFFLPLEDLHLNFFIAYSKLQTDEKRVYKIQKQFFFNLLIGFNT